MCRGPAGSLCGLRSSRCCGRSRCSYSWYSPTVGKPRETNLTKAKELLAKSGVKTTVSFTIYVGQGDNIGKSAAIEQLLSQENLSWAETCFVGDDIIDLGPLTRAGLAVAVGDAVAEAKAAAHFTTKAAGGRGAVREAVELILRAQEKWNQFLEKYSE